MESTPPGLLKFCQTPGLLGLKRRFIGFSHWLFCFLGFWCPSSQRWFFSNGILNNFYFDNYTVYPVYPEHLGTGSERQLLPVHLQEGSCMEWPTTPLCTIHHPVTQPFSTVVRCSATRGLLGSEPAPFYRDNNIVVNNVIQSVKAHRLIWWRGLGEVQLRCSI